MSREQFFNVQREVAVAPNEEARLIARFCQVISRLGYGGDALDPFGGVPGGITDFRVGPNHGGPRPEVLLVVRNLVGGLGDEAMHAIQREFGDENTNSALQLINAQNNIQPNP